MEGEIPASETVSVQKNIHKKDRHRAWDGTKSFQEKGRRPFGVGSRAMAARKRTITSRVSSSSGPGM